MEPYPKPVQANQQGWQLRCRIHPWRRATGVQTCFKTLMSPQLGAEQLLVETQNSSRAGNPCVSNLLQVARGRSSNLLGPIESRPGFTWGLTLAIVMLGQQDRQIGGTSSQSPSRLHCSISILCALRRWDPELPSNAHPAAERYAGCPVRSEPC